VDPPAPAAAAGVQAEQRRRHMNMITHSVLTSHTHTIVATKLAAALFAPSWR
jgi:hypothetical protein